MHSFTTWLNGTSACILVYNLTTKPCLTTKRCKLSRLHQLLFVQELQAPTPADSAQNVSSALHALLQSAFEEVDPGSSAASSITQAQTDLRDLMDNPYTVPVRAPSAVSDQQLNSSLAGNDDAEMILMLFCIRVQSRLNMQTEYVLCGGTCVSIVCNGPSAGTVK